jgi:hypothetical protein
MDSAPRKVRYQFSVHLNKVYGITAYIYCVARTRILCIHRVRHDFASVPNRFGIHISADMTKGCTGLSQFHSDNQFVG